MLIYSKTTASFIARLSLHAREIMRKEMNLEIRRNRFLFNGYLIPFSIVVFEKENLLGMFDSHSYRIGINKNLMYLANTETIKNILRHELVHMMAFLIHKHEISPHGQEYHQLCQKYNWGKNVYRAYADIQAENNATQGDIPSERLLIKIKKLLALASSSNKYESELATIKANQLLLDHNLSFIDDFSKEDKEVYVKRVLHNKQKNAKICAILKIIETFYVSPVISYGNNSIYLEVIGNKTNVILADYVANFLDRELENLWEAAKKENKSLKGITKKNSFMNGVAQGYIDKIKQAQQQTAETKALILLQSTLKQQVKLVYSRLSSSKSRASSLCSNSLAIGRQAGRNLNIHKGVENSSKVFLLNK